MFNSHLQMATFLESKYLKSIGQVIHGGNGTFLVRRFDIGQAHFFRIHLLAAVYVWIRFQLIALKAQRFA